MNGVLVDANVIIDILTEDPVWFDWSSDMLAHYADHHPLCINKIIYSEISMAYERIEDLEEHVSKDVFTRVTMPWEAAFLAGKAFLKYKKEGGKRHMPLPDFFIGAHATVSGFALLTRDQKRFQYYFPKLEIVSPERMN